MALRNARVSHTPWIRTMRINTISSLKTVALQSATGSGIAILIGLDIPDEEAADSFVGDVAEKFKLHRMCSPPETDTLLITIIGNVHAAYFAARWHEIVMGDDILRSFMSQMRQAAVVRGTKDGIALEEASLLDNVPTTPLPESATATVIFSGNAQSHSYDSDLAYKRWQGSLGAYLAEAKTLYSERRLFGVQRPVFGRIVWGVFTRAFWPIYGPGKNNHNGSVVFSFDPFFENSPGLFEISQDLRQLREGSGEPKHLVKFAAVLRDDHKAPDRLRIPDGLAGGRKAFFQSIFIPRNRLPGNYLHHRLVPVIASKFGSSAEILPLKFWPDGFKKTWSLGDPLLSPDTLAEYRRRYPQIKP